ncbi:hypothetical protein [Aquamicrobium soli]|uniref:Uncharacterized protein n=1 Tax=Aquamicrobium soli TaxID=1811518 RepID=A0ABV7KB90_9HYPH
MNANEKLTATFAVDAAQAPDCAGRNGAPGKLYWEHTRGGMGGAHAVLMADDGKYVGHFYDDVSEGVDIDAVLALTAAAPELLAFAKWCVSEQYDSREHSIRALAAIAKAECRS